jgi:hypothetical protein
MGTVYLLVNGSAQLLGISTKSNDSIRMDLVIFKIKGKNWKDEKNTTQKYNNNNNTININYTRGTEY